MPRFASFSLLPRRPRSRVLALLIVAVVLAASAYTDPQVALAVGIFLAAVQVIIGVAQVLGIGDKQKGEGGVR